MRSLSLVLSIVCLGACHESGVDFRDVASSDVIDDDVLRPQRTIFTSLATGVAPPDYTIDVDPLRVEADDNGIVQTSSGSADATDGLTTGQAYVVLEALASTSYADIDAAFRGNPQVAITGPDPSVAAAAFELVGLDLDLEPIRYVIFANTVADVGSYQLITITFRGPR